MNGPARRSRSAYEVANGLHWVQAEIDASLTRARSALEQYVDEPDEPAPLNVAQDELRIVRGCLMVIECFGGRALAEEMTGLLDALINGLSTNRDEAFSALSGATMQLADYIDLLAHGTQDLPLILQPLINELRLARGQALVTEAELFARQLQAQSVEPLPLANSDAANGTAQAIARRELGGFQAAFLQWFRGLNGEAAIDRIGKICDRIAVNCVSHHLQAMWHAYGALAECLRGANTDTLEIKRLIGRAGSQIKVLAEGDEPAALREAGDALQQSLFYLARTTSPTERSRELVQQYRLDWLLPPIERIEELRRRLRGPNTVILNRVCEEIRRDFAQVKDGIDLAVRTGGRSSVDLSLTRERMQRLAQTLGALGLPMPQQALQNQAALVEKLSPGVVAWMEVAIAILRIEHSLEETLFRAMRRDESTPQRSFGQIEAETPHGRDLRESLAALVRESMVNFAQVKNGVDLYLKGGDSALLMQAPYFLHQISAALKILGRDRGAEVMALLETYADSGRLYAAQTRRAEFERFADAVSCAEVYFEALRDDLPSPLRILDDLIFYVDRMIQPVAEGDEPIESLVPGTPVVDAPVSAEAEAAAPDGESEREAETFAAPAVDEPAPIVVAVAPSEPAERAPMSAPMGEGIDPEIREVFVEEAGEVLGALKEHLPALRREPRNREVLVEIRRAFHTLKGSGRMVGALRVGEFAWAVEQMLNRCLDGALAVRAQVLEVIGQSVELLPGLIDNLQHGGDEHPDVEGVIAHANRLATGVIDGEPDLRAVFREDARERLGFVRRWLESQDPTAETFAVEPEVVRAFHTLRGSAAVVHAQSVRELAAVFENYLNAVRIRGRSLPLDALALMADALVTLHNCVESDDAGTTRAIDIPDWQGRTAAMLDVEYAADAGPATSVDEAFTLEALDLMQSMEGHVREWARVPTVSGAMDLRAGFSNLAQSAERASCLSIGTVAQAVAGRLANWGADQEPGRAFFSNFLDIFEGLYQWLDAYRDGERAADPTVLLAKVQTLAPPVAGTIVNLDPELLEIFGGEAEELLDALDDNLAAWTTSPESVERLADLKRNLHTLKGSARTAGVLAMGDVAHRIENELAEFNPEDPALTIARVTVGIDGLDGLLDSLNRGEPLHIDAVITRIGEAQTAQVDSQAASAPLAESREADPVKEVVPAMAPPPPTQDLKAPAAPAKAEPFTVPVPAAEPAPRPSSADIAPSGPAASEDDDEDAPFARMVAQPVRAVETGGLDQELTDIFSAEASELLEQLDVGFEAWQNGEQIQSVLDIQRALHTFKGGARMARLDVMGDVAHELESQVNAIQYAGEFPDAARFVELRGQLDVLQHMQDQIQRGEADSLVAPETPALRSEAVAPLVAKPTIWAAELLWKPEQDAAGLAAARRETARVAVDSLDSMLNEAGEVSIYRSRLEERNSGLRTQLVEMSQTITRVRDQLRMMDAETDAQIAARGLTSSGAAQGVDRYAQDFDPLEMDRYSRMQELSRALAESINDLTSLQGTMDEAVHESESLLLQQSRINTQLQHGLMGTLMVPFSRQVQRLSRVVRQTAQENGKQAEVLFSGAEAELDRNVLERITAPLEHLLRNAVVHGIETPQARLQAGKLESGRISVSLLRDGGQVRVELSDDGAGLNLPAIRAKAIERGLLAEETALSEADLARFIFEPGFSTAKILTQDAGRGIGMDVVASEVKQLGGTLDLRSQKGQGTRFELRLPLSLAVSQVLLIGAGSEIFGIPLASVEGIARIPRAELSDHYREDGPLFAYGGRGYRVHHISEYLDLPRGDVDGRTAVAILIRLGERVGGKERRMALVVDRLYGNRDIVTKAVGPQVSNVAGVVSATILADGRVVLILDVPTLVSERLRRALLNEVVHRAPAPRPTRERDTIMVVDDSITMRRVAERLLTRNGYRVITAKDGLDAIAILATETPKTMLLDIEMPRADGFEVAAFMRNSDRLQHVPIIMITSRSGEKHRERARQLGVKRYLIKPYQEDQLLNEVNTVHRRD